MAAAEQAVWRTVGRSPAAATRFETFREPHHLRLGVAVVGGVLDVGVVGGDPLQQHALLGGCGPGQGHGVLHLEPLPVGAGLELHVDAGRPAQREGGAGQRRDGRRVVEGEPQVRGDGVGEVLRRRVAEAEDGDVRADQAAQRDALVGAPDREPGGAGPERRRSHDGDAVAVGLRLHDGREPRPAQASLEGADVGGQRREVDLEPAHRSRRQSGGARGRRGSRGHSRSVARRGRRLDDPDEFPRVAKRLTLGSASVTYRVPVVPGA